MLAMQAISLAVSVLASQQAAKLAEKGLALTPSWLPSIVALLIVGCGGYYVMQFLFELVFDKWRWLRIRLLGSQFIEGLWYIIFMVEGEPVAFGVTRIMSTEEGVRFQGEDFQIGGEGRGHYKTDLAILDWPTIKYKYHYHQAAAEEHSTAGYGEASFSEGRQSAEKFSGIFFELLQKRVTYYEGWRVPKNDLNDGDFEFEKHKRTKAKTFFREIFPKMFPGDDNTKDDKAGM